MMKLYYEKGTCALASHIALEEAGAEYSTVRVNFAVQEQRSADYLAINPKARVPSLVTDRGVLTETPAMLAFIAQSFPRARLAPLDDFFGFAEVQAFNSYLCSTVHVAHAHRMRGQRWADDPAGGPLLKVVAYLGVTTHMEDMVKGVVDLKDVVFYLSFIVFGLFLAQQSIESQRWRA